MSSSRDLSMDRVIGALLGMAVGDALGAPYEFGRGPRCAEMKGGGGFGWEPGEWTDDTQMAICIAEECATGALDPPAAGDRFIQWFRQGPKDVGIQTSAVLGGATKGSDLPEIAAEYCRTHPRCGGNGSLMRTAPVALASLGQRDTIAENARAVSDLTHADPHAGDACVLWSLAIDHAIHHGEFDLREGLDHIPPDRRQFWEEKITEAETQPPNTFTGNGYVVTALQAAWSSITQADHEECVQWNHIPCTHLQRALHTAIGIGDDTDTVAAIAGGLLGARWGASAIPLRWKRMLHGWPGYDARDLARLASLAALGGKNGDAGWPGEQSLLPHYQRTNPATPLTAPLPSDPGLEFGNVHAALDTRADVIVSLCRMGSEPLRPDGRHVDVLLIDHDSVEKNPNLEFIVRDTVAAIAGWRASGESVFVHCVHAQSRTPTIAAAYLVLQHGTSPSRAWAEIEALLGVSPWNTRFVETVYSLHPITED